jgi:MFS family permease
VTAPNEASATAHLVVVADEDEARTVRAAPDRRPLSGMNITVLVAASFGAALVLIVPIAFTLALRVDQLAPGRPSALGYLIGAGSIGTLMSGPVVGILSDRTRTRWGRRRPFTVAGTLLGLVSIPVMAYAPGLVVLGTGWVLASLGWGTALGSIGSYQADRLPAHQRGKVAGLTGMTSYVAPICGILLASPVTHDPLLVFLLPAAAGVPLVALFVLFAHEEDSRHLVHDGRLTLGSVLRSYGYRPGAHPDFSWNWLGRFVFFSGLSLITSYSTFFYSERLAIPVQSIAPTIAVISTAGVVASVGGSLLGGALSDRVGRRRPFVLAGAVLYGAGTAVSASAHSLPVLIVGAVGSSLGVAVFLTANQALVLDVLPHRETQAGRYMAIAAFSQSIPTALAPLFAPLVLMLGTRPEPSFTALYLTAGALAALGGAIVTLGVRGAR